jgi:hypothetical protein
VSVTQSFADITGMHFAVDMGFAHTAGDELGDLGAEVKNENLWCDCMKRALSGHWRIVSKKQNRS